MDKATISLPGSNFAYTIGWANNSVNWLADNNNYDWILNNSNSSSSGSFASYHG